MKQLRKSVVGVFFDASDRPRCSGSCPGLSSSKSASSKANESRLPHSRWHNAELTLVITRGSGERSHLWSQRCESKCCVATWICLEPLSPMIERECSDGEESSSQARIGKTGSVANAKRCRFKAAVPP